MEFKGYEIKIAAPGTHYQGYYEIWKGNKLISEGILGETDCKILISRYTLERLD